jgi:hypothetical protein
MMNNITLVQLFLWGNILDMIPWDNIPVDSKQIIVVSPYIKDFSIITELSQEGLEVLFVETSSIISELGSNEY